MSLERAVGEKASWRPDRPAVEAQTQQIDPFSAQIELMYRAITDSAQRGEGLVSAEPPQRELGISRRDVYVNNSSGNPVAMREQHDKRDPDREFDETTTVYDLDSREPKAVSTGVLPDGRRLIQVHLNGQSISFFPGEEHLLHPDQQHDIEQVKQLFGLSQRT